MNQKTHSRSSSYGLRAPPQHAKSSKPPPPARSRGSYNHTRPANQTSGAVKLGPASSKKIRTEVVQQGEAGDEDEGLGGMESFLQFCATCERQIVTPINSILYCSESCRRKDVSHETPLDNPRPLSITTPRSSYLGTPAANIVPPRSPTVLRPASLYFLDFPPSDPCDPTDDMSNTCHLPNGEAAPYFPPFDPSPWTAAIDRSPQPRPDHEPPHADGADLPSLIHTPSSSVGTLASLASNRPLASRGQPASPSALRPTSTDLIAPCTPRTPSNSTHLVLDASPKGLTRPLPHAVAAAAVTADDPVYVKRPAAPRRESQALGSLRQLFQHDAMRAPPPPE